MKQKKTTASTKNKIVKVWFNYFNCTKFETKIVIKTNLTQQRKQALNAYCFMKNQSGRFPVKLVGVTKLLLLYIILSSCRIIFKWTNEYSPHLFTLFLKSTDNFCKLRSNYYYYYFFFNNVTSLVSIFRSHAEIVLQ